jgi:hypothetical protein
MINLASKIVCILASLMAIVAGLTYVAWTTHQTAMPIKVNPSGSQYPLVKTLEPVSHAQIPSAYDRTIDLLTGNLLGQTPPANVSSIEFKDFCNLVQSNWGSYTQQMGAPMMAWSANELNLPIQKVFYPFSGPDFTTVYQLFPQAHHYVMIAQQRGERMVDLRQLDSKVAGQTLEVFSSAWESFGKNGFFVTEYLFKYISQNKVKIGATTLIASFAHLHQFSIQKIVPIALNEEGKVQELGESDSWNSVRFYMIKDKKEVVLDYLSMDLSDKGMKAAPNQITFFEESAQSPTLLKAASHLPQNASFLIITNKLLQNAPLIVQDETGLDYAPLSKEFDTVLYGSFVKAYKVFSKYNRELAKAYQERGDEKPLPFRVGYFKDGNYALIVATKKK